MEYCILQQVGHKTNLCQWVIAFDKSIVIMIVSPTMEYVLLSLLKRHLLWNRLACRDPGATVDPGKKTVDDFYNFYTP